MSHRLTQQVITRRKAAARAAATKLTATGMAVIVVRDDGSELTTKLRSLPWQLGDGSFVCSVEGISGAYCCTRVRPAPSA